MAAAAPRPLAAQELDAPTRLRVDSVFRRYDRTDSPGCALLVRKDGRTAYARGYGMGSLELGVADAFIADGPPLRFVRDARQRVIAISVTGRAVRDLRWLRVAP